MSKIKAPLRKPDVDLMSKLDQFAGEVNETTESTPVAQAIKSTRSRKYPWEDSKVRSDVVRGMGVPLTEPHLLKLRYIAENTKWSQRKFCQAKLEEAIDKEITAIMKQT